MPRRTRVSSDAPSAGWWGDGAPPWERWPDVTIATPAKWARRRKRWESPCGAYYFDAERSTRPEDFFRQHLVHTKAPWDRQPFELLDWQKLLITRPLFGWIQKSDGMRRFRSVFVEVAKKNGKSALASGLAIYLLCADGEAGAEVYSAAGNEEQARIVFGEAANMVSGSRKLVAAAGLRVHKRAIMQLSSRSTYKVLSKSPGTKHGFNVSGLCFDEFHTQPTRTLWDTLSKGTSARTQPVTFVITTAGSDRESICFEQYEHARAVIAGDRLDPRFLPIVFELRRDDDWTDEAAWYRANPSLGVTKRIEYMRDECRSAMQEPRKRNSFLNLELNVWTESRVVWIAPESFERLAREEREPAFLSKFACVGGIDLSSKVDLTSMVLAFREPDSGPGQEIAVEDGVAPVFVDYRVHLVEWYWIPAERMADRIKRDRVPYDLWVEQGWINTTPGAIIHYGAIFQHILATMSRWKPTEIAYDPWGATDLAQRLVDESVPMVECRQGYATLSAPSKLFEALVLSGRLTYSGSPVTRWCVANSEVTTDPAGNIKPVKPDAKGPRRIDGVTAAVTALSRLMVLPVQKVRTASDFLAWI